MARKSEIIRGEIAASSEVKTYTKNNRQGSQKCVLHIVADDGTERAITAAGELANWRGCDGRRVEVEYVNRVFTCPTKDGDMDWICNDMYAVNIKLI